jgi:hypothetical protein
MTMTGLLGHGHKSAEQQQEIREAKRLLKERVKDDWDYPPLPQYQSQRRQCTDAEEHHAEARVAGFRVHTPSGQKEAAVEAEFEAVEWREREYSESESEGEGPASANSEASNGSKYRFEGPDSVGAQITDRRLARKRKRQKKLEDEMSWNEGLAHWMARRDAWAGARTADQVKEFEHRRQNQEGNASTSNHGSTATSPRTSTSSTSSHEAAHQSSAATTPDPAPRKSSSPENEGAQPSSSTSPASILVPVAAPILPNHPVRRRISPSMYHEIYTKIIVQSRTPSVPINLRTLIAALVQGWKEDGEWPPKSGPPEPSIGKKRSNNNKDGGESGFKHGVKVMGRVLRLAGVGEGHHHHNRNHKEEG